jgi:hypothetical protein
MGNDWIVDVLADLRSFAQNNGLPVLAVQLNDAALVAQAEIAQSNAGAPMTVRGETAETRSLLIQAGTSRRS